MKASPRGLVVAGTTTTGSNGVVDAEHGRAFLHPGKIPLPVFAPSPNGTEFSPDGRFLLVASNLTFTRPAAGARAVRQSPSAVILSVPDLRVVQRVVGVDPSWVGPTTVAFRNGKQAYRLEVGREPVAVGVPQGAFACANEDFSPQTPCRNDWYTNTVGGDPRQTFWVTETYWGGDYTQGTWERLDVLDLERGLFRTLVQIDDPRNVAGLAMRNESVSPGAVRACAVREQPGRAELLCAALPNGAVERVMTFAKTPSETVWLDGSRLLVLHDGGRDILDLAKGTRTRVLGAPEGAKWATVLPGGHQIVLASPTVRIVDLDARTVVDTKTTSAWLVEPVPTPGGGFYVSSKSAAGTRAFTWIGQ